MNLQTAVPARLPRLRPMQPRDRAQIVAWIGRGRQERAFRETGALTLASLARYQQGVRRAGWTYDVLVIEDGGRDVGFVDYRLRGRRGEILGLFVDKRVRGGRIGRHVVRWVAADLRQRGCRDVVTEVYADNAPCLRALAAVGFSAGRRRQEDGRELIRLVKPLPPLRRLSPANPRYATVTGDNLYLHHVAVAEALVEGINAQVRPELVLGLGSLARGFADAWSDLDLAVVGRGQALSRLWRGERWFAGLSVDLYAVDLDAAPPSGWDETRRQAFEESVVLSARRAAAVPALARALRLRRSEQRDRIRDLLLKIGWHGFEPRRWFNRRRLGYIWALPHDLWISRGCAGSAHATIDRVLDFVLQVLFLLNQRHVPDPKWRRFLAPGLAWLPAGFPRRLAAVEQAGRDRAGFAARARALFDIIEPTVARAEAGGLVRGDIYAAYLRTPCEYDPKA